MKQYRKKPVIIEAIQFLNDVDRILEIQEFAEQETIRVDYKDKNNPTLKIDTLEGVMTASVGDYIIKGVQGEFYPCKPDIFEKTYEEAQQKQSIIDRATNYAYMVAGGSADIVLAGEAYQRGAEDEHRLLTEWHNALKELPDLNKPVLVRDVYDEYHIGTLTEKGWNVETWMFVEQGFVVEWRELWEQ